ncbi:hypothetical protein [Sphaerisporangium fuscum]|uniref:hypothetical protein n=1 Tax=Sphaerisporangium fuscum TaxID=2835868 RepID=UPI001BDD36CA|nr:hypothetical protein [Sphaerisporangium fuscum]
MLGLVLRGLAMLGYRPALFFWADSFTYLESAAHPVPGAFRPLGYSLFLAALAPGPGLTLVTAVQHLLGVGIAVAVYASQVRRGLSRWAAIVLVVPLLYDEFLILLEHMVMADALFTVLVTGGVLVLLRQRLTAAAAALAGVVLSLAALTRTIGVLVLALAAAWLLLKRGNGWRVWTTFAAAGLAPLLAYATWMSATSGVFGLTRADGLFLWARTTTFADCSVIRPEPRLAPLCPGTPVASRPAPPYWLWSSWSPVNHVHGDRNGLARGFARAAILAQPGDYLAAAGSDLRRLLRWERTTSRDAAVRRTNPYWFPFEERSLRPSVRPAAEAYEGGPAATRVHEPYAGWLRAYQRFGYLPFPLLVLALAGTLIVAAVRRRRDALLPALTAAALILAPPFLTGFDVRYVIPALPSTCLAAGLALAGTADRLRGPR